jgi:HEAT repeat protein
MEVPDRVHPAKAPAPHIRREAAAQLSQTDDPRAVSSLLAALKERDLSVISGASLFFLRPGEPG